MKVLNADAQEFVPGGLSSAFAPKAGKQATTLTIPITAAIGPPKGNVPIITIGATKLGVDVSLPTLNGLAELATCLSDNLTFEELFDQGSRQNSVGLLFDFPPRHHGCLRTLASSQHPSHSPQQLLQAYCFQGFLPSQQPYIYDPHYFHSQHSSLQPCYQSLPAHLMRYCTILTPTCCPSLQLAGQLSAAEEVPEAAEEQDEFHDADGEESDSASTHSDASNNTTRSTPMAITAQRKGAAETAEAVQQQHEEAAAVAKAQRDLLADAVCVQSVVATDKTQPKLGPQDFEILRVVGQGAFGKVRHGSNPLCQ